MSRSRRKIPAVAKLAAAAVLLVLMGGAAYKLRGRIPKRYKDWLKPTSSRLAEARVAYNEGDWSKADELARRLIKDRGDSPEALRILARASGRLEHDQTASAIYSERLKGAALDSEDYFLLGQGLARLGRFETALELFKKGEAAGPDRAELYDHLARLAGRLQRLDEASAAAMKLAKQPGWEARGLLLLGHIRGLLDDDQGSVEALKKALEIDPEATGAILGVNHFRRQLARGLLRLGRPAEAIAPLEAMSKANGLSGVDPETDWLLSRALLAQGRAAEASPLLASAAAYRAAHPGEPEPSPYVGEARCVSCHAAIAKVYNSSRHALTFHHGADLLRLPRPDQPLADPDRPQATHTIAESKGALVAETKVDDKVFHVVVDYAFGLRDRYVTMIGKGDDAKYRALRLSYYHTKEGTGWGRTAGDVGADDPIETVRGAEIDVRDGVVRCLYCHTTLSREFRDPPPAGGRGPEAADKGIGCERCHGPGANHLAAVKAGWVDKAVANVGAGSGEAATGQCAQCHITGVRSEIEANPEDPRYVRSTAVTLALSRCYTESAGVMSCLTCHDPHQDDVHEAAVHEAKCLGCHTAAASDAKTLAAGSTAPLVKAGPCKVNPRSGCLGCHMPKVPVPTLHTSLTDHYIRIRKPAASAEKSK